MGQEQVYELIRPAFDAMGGHVDIQTDFMERLEIVAVTEGLKPAFYAIAPEGTRRKLFEAVAAALPSSIGVTGFVEASIHTRYRDLKLPADITDIVDRKSRDPAQIFWLTKDEAIAARFADGQLEQMDHDIAGYPVCCATWHYDTFFARSIEAFWDVYSFKSEGERKAYVNEVWEQSSGWFLPRSHYLIGIYRSNLAYPFIPHIACPRCLADKDGASAQQHKMYSDLALRVDPGRHAAVLAWAEDMRPMLTNLVSNARHDAARTSDDYGFEGRDKDDFQRHSRYLLKALGIG